MVFAFAHTKKLPYLQNKVYTYMHNYNNVKNECSYIFACKKHRKVFEYKMATFKLQLFYIIKK